MFPEAYDNGSPFGSNKIIAIKAVRKLLGPVTALKEAVSLCTTPGPCVIDVEYPDDTEEIAEFNLAISQLVKAGCTVSNTVGLITALQQAYATAEQLGEDEIVAELRRITAFLKLKYN